MKPSISSRRSAHVGNIYVNRNMVGAVVGVQPFGGEGKSGTGPKAGGPLYLHRLLRQAPMSLAARVSSARRVNRVNGRAGAFASAYRVGAADRPLSHRRTLHGLCRCTPLMHSIPLPGPTGESNTLMFAPRGEVACIANDEAALLRADCRRACDRQPLCLRTDRDRARYWICCP